jgi:hypothetical protein
MLGKPPSVLRTCVSAWSLIVAMWLTVHPSIAQTVASPGSEGAPPPINRTAALPTDKDKKMARVLLDPALVPKTASTPVADPTPAPAPSPAPPARLEDADPDLPPLPNLPPTPPAEVPPDVLPDAGGGVTRVGCSSCGGMGQLRGPTGVNFPCSSCGGSGCVPGRKNCEPVYHHTYLGRLFGNLYECICCPDPCYEPSWIPVANAAFFVDTARPRTMQRIRYNGLTDVQFPDRAEFFWAREMLPGGPGKGPGKPKIVKFAKHYRGELSTNIAQLTYYQEAASERASFFIELPYQATNPVYTPRHAGFGDMNLGTKAMFFDCELMQLTFQFKTYIPTGNPANGTGNGHTTLEPSLLTSVRLAPKTYFQGQLAEWIPLGGDMNYQGSILHYHFSYNHVLFNLAADTPLIGTFEMNGYSYQTGGYTDPTQKTPQRYSGGQGYFSVGPGLRMSVCNNLDVGAAAAFPVSEPHIVGPSIRVEVRFLY